MGSELYKNDDNLKEGDDTSIKKKKGMKVSIWIWKPSEGRGNSREFTLREIGKLIN